MTERGDGAPVQRHKRFRVFGAMNPATDVGKRDLPPSLKHRFTEVYAGECEGREDLCLLVSNGLRGVPNAPIDAVVDFYLAARFAARTTLVDSADQKPQYSLRTLSRAMEYVRHAAPVYGIQRALYDGFAMSFQTLLKHESAAALERLITQHLLKGAPLKVSNQSFCEFRRVSDFFLSSRQRKRKRKRKRKALFGPPLQPVGSSSWTRRGPDWGGRATDGAQYLFSARRTEKCGRERARRAAPHIRLADAVFSFFPSKFVARLSDVELFVVDDRSVPLIADFDRSLPHDTTRRIHVVGCVQSPCRASRRPPRAGGAVLGRSRRRRARRPRKRRSVRGDPRSAKALVVVGARGAVTAAPDFASRAHVFRQNLAGGVPRRAHGSQIRPHQQPRAHRSAGVPGELRHRRGRHVPRPETLSNFISVTRFFFFSRLEHPYVRH